MKISEIVKKGTLTYTHHYMQTMTSEETCDHELAVPKALLALTEKHPKAKIAIFGEGSLGILIGGKI